MHVAGAELCSESWADEASDLAETSGIRMFDLIESRPDQGGGSAHRSRSGWTAAPRLREAEVITLVERSIIVFERLLFKDIVRSNVLTASSGLRPGAPTVEELTLGDAWLEVFQQVLPRSQFCAAGKLVARAYDEFGEEPPRRQQFVDGAPRQVKSYRRWGCTQGRGPLQWHLENVEATITGWSRKHLRL